MSVESTTNYDQFKLLEQNRAIIKSHVNKLKQAIENNTNILKAQPILVNEDMEIIDGQHRFTVCKELGIPVYYTIVRGLSVKEARVMNAIQRGWSALDYAESYAKAGNVYYKALVEYKREHPSIGLSVIRIVCAGKGTGRTTEQNHAFRVGEFTINRDSEEVSWFLTKIDEIHEALNGEIPTRSPFVSAFIEAVDNHDDFDTEDFIRNLKSAPEMFSRVATIRDGLRMIEDIYNYHKSANRIRLY